MSDPWRDPDRYKTGRIVKCLGCGKKCHKSPWGCWCYTCNVERIDRINGRFAPFATALKTAGVGDALKENDDLRELLDKTADRKE